MENEDIRQEVFEEVWRRIDTAEFDNEYAVLAWLKTITQSEIQSHERFYRAERRTRRREEAAELDHVELSGNLLSQIVDKDVLSEVVDKEEKRRIRAALRKLPRAMRQVIRLHYLVGLSMTEAARRMGQPPATVRYQRKIGLTRLSYLLRD